MAKGGIKVLGLAAAGGVGYYLYAAGGDPKVAQKKFEHDAAAASSKVKSELPGREKEAKKTAEEYSAAAGAKFDSAVDSARAKWSEAEKKADQYSKEGSAKLDQLRKDASADINASIDKFDKTVTQKSAEAKSGVSSWLGFGGK